MKEKREAQIINTKFNTMRITKEINDNFAKIMANTITKSNVSSLRTNLLDSVKD